jgi:hypothetical protein
MCFGQCCGAGAIDGDTSFWPNRSRNQLRLRLQTLYATYLQFLLSNSHLIQQKKTKKNMQLRNTGLDLSIRRLIQVKCIKYVTNLSQCQKPVLYLYTESFGLFLHNPMLLVGIYYAVTMVLTTAATVLGVVVLRIHHQACILPCFITDTIFSIFIK